jgi:hypothetical protein
LATATAARDAVLDRLAYQLAELRGALDRAAAANAVMAREIVPSAFPANDAISLHILAASP